MASIVKKSKYEKKVKPVDIIEARQGTPGKRKQGVQAQKANKPASKEEAIRAVGEETLRRANEYRRYRGRTNPVETIRDRNYDLNSRYGSHVQAYLDILEKNRPDTLAEAEKKLVSAQTDMEYAKKNNYQIAWWNADDKRIEAQKNYDEARRRHINDIVSSNGTSLVQVTAARDKFIRELDISKPLSDIDKDILNAFNAQVESLKLTTPLDPVQREEVIAEIEQQRQMEKAGKMLGANIKANSKKAMINDNAWYYDTGAELGANLTVDEWNKVMERPENTLQDAYAFMRGSSPNNNGKFDYISHEAWDLLVGKFGRKKANQYYQYIKQQHDAEDMQKQQQVIASMTNKLGGEIAGSAVSIPANLIGGTTGVVDLAAQGLRKAVTGTPVNWNSPAQQMAAFAPEVRSNVSSHIQYGRDGTKEGTWRDVYAFLYNTSMSMADSALAMAVGGSNGGLLLYGSAATSAAREAKERGASDWQALGTAYMAGAAELVFETVSIDSFLNIGKASDAYEIVFSILNQSMTEASEETLTSLSNTVTDLLINGQASQIQTDIRNYMAQGYSERDATQKAISDWAASVGQDALGGLVSGGMFGTVANIKQSAPELYETIQQQRGNKRTKTASNSPVFAPYTTEPTQGEAKQSKGVSVTDSAIVKRSKGQPVGGYATTTAGEGGLVQRTFINGLEDGKNGVLMARSHSVDADDNPDLKNATSVPAASIDFEDRTTQALLTHAQEMGLNAQQAEAYIGGYDADSGMTMEQYNDAFDAVRTVAQQGLDKNAALETIANTNASYAPDDAGYVHVEGLTDTAVEAAVQSVKPAEATQVDVDAQQMKQQKTVLDRASTVDMSEVPANVRAHLSNDQRAAVNFGKALNAVFGINVKFTASRLKNDGTYEGSQGSYERETNTITIDLNAGKLSFSDKRAIIHTFGHELTHFVEARSKTQYKVLRQFVVDKLTEMGQLENRIKEAQDDYRAAFGEELSREDAISEVVAESCSDLIGDSDMMEEMERKSPGLVATIREYLRGILDKIESLLKGYEKDRQSDEAKLLENYREEMLRLWNAAFAEAVQSDSAIDSESKLQHQARKNSNENDNYETYGVHWGMEYGLLTKQDAAIIWKAIDEINHLKYNYPMTTDGKRIITSDTGVFVVDADEHFPVVEAIFKLKTKNKVKRDNVRGVIVDDIRKSGGRSYSYIVEISSAVFGEGVTEGNYIGDYPTVAREISRRKSSYSGRDTKNALTDKVKQYSLRKRVTFKPADIITDGVDVSGMNSSQKTQLGTYVSTVNDLNDVSRVVNDLRNGLETATQNLTQDQLYDYLDTLDSYAVKADELRNKLVKLEKGVLKNVVDVNVRQQVSMETGAVRAEVTARYEAQLAALKLQQQYDVGQWREKVRQERENVKAEKQKARLQHALDVQRLNDYRADVQNRFSEMRKTKQIESIRSRARHLEKQLESNSKNNHVPESIAIPLAEMLKTLRKSDVFDTGGQGGKTFLAAMERLQGAIGTHMENAASDFGGMMAKHYANSEVYGIIQSTINEVEKSVNGSFRQHTAAELREIDKLLRELERDIAKANALPSMERNKTAQQQAEKLVADINSGKTRKYKGKIARQFKVNQLTSVYFFDHFGEVGKQMFTALRKGESEAKRREVAIVNAVRDIADSKAIRKWRSSKSKITLKTKNGAEISMSLTEALELYIQTKQADAVQHILNHGIILTENAQDGGDATAFTQEDIDAFVKEMQNNHGDIVKAADALSDVVLTLTKWGNATSMDLYGFYMFTIENYWPISAYDVSKKEVSIAPTMESGGAYAMLNRSFMKNRSQNAAGALVVGDAFNTLASHAAGMINYSTLAIPMLDCMKIMNQNGAKAAIEKAYGKDMMPYFQKLMEDMNGVSGRDSGSWLLTAYKRAAVGFSLRTAILQGTSYLRAASVLSPASLGKGEVTGYFKLRKNWQEALQYSGVALNKSGGYFDANMGSTSLAREFSDERSGFVRLYSAVTDGSMWLAGMVDKVTWSKLWEASKYEARRKNPDLKGEALMEAATDIFEDMIYRTQVTDSVLAKSQQMRSDNFRDQLQTMFMSEPVLTYNILLDTVRSYRFAPKGQKKRAAKKVALSMTATAMTFLATTIVEGLSNAIRDDDEYETIGQKLLQGLWDSFKSNVFWSDNIPLLSDIRSLLEGYSIDREDMTSIASVIKAAQQVWESVQVARGKQEPTKLTYYGRLTNYGVFEKALQAMSMVTGLPFYNALREVRTIWDTLSDDPEFWGDVYDEGTGRAYDMMYEAAVNGSTKEYNRVLGMVMERGEDTEDVAVAMKKRITEGYENGMSEEMATKLLVQYGGMSEDGKGSKSIAYALDKVGYDGEDTFTIAGSIVETMRTGNAQDVAAEIERVMERYDATESSIKSSIAGELKQEYIEGSKTEREKIIDMLENTGLYDDPKKNDERETADGWIRSYYQTEERKAEYLKADAGRRREIEEEMWSSGGYESKNDVRKVLEGWRKDKD